MKNKNTIIWVLVFLFLGIITFGRLPDTIGPSGFYWQLTGDHPNNENIPNSDITPPKYAKDMIQITNVSPRREIYYTGENATIDIEIYNPYNLNYNLSVDWILDNQKYSGWKTKDNVTILYSWYPLNKEGTWIANVVVNWNYYNKTYDTDKNIEVEVLK